jgi:phosphoribosylformylglycinamidine cyclo-ligase
MADGPPVASEAADGRLSYAAAGVDIDAADRAVELLKPHVQTTLRPEVIGGVGGFGGLFALPSGYRRPVLVASTDGVGTKVAVAIAANRLDTIGIDLVAMCVDDLVCQGAEPLFFLDYQLWGRLDPERVAVIMSGMAEGCRQAGCAIVGGELAEHPGQLPDGEVDLAGFAVGIVERDRILDGSGCRPGAALIGLHSPGLRSNGYSLARRALLDRAGLTLDEAAWEGAQTTVADELLRPSVIYSQAVLALIRTVEVHAVAHITGGGVPGNLPRVLPAGVSPVIRPGSWPVPPIFAAVQAAGRVADGEMRRTFNLGLGMIAVVDPSDAARSIEVLEAHGIGASVVGQLREGAPTDVRYED